MFPKITNSPLSRSQSNSTLDDQSRSSSPTDTGMFTAGISTPIEATDVIDKLMEPNQESDEFPFRVVNNAFQTVCDTITSEQACRIIDKLIEKNDTGSLSYASCALECFGKTMTSEQNSNYTNVIFNKLFEKNDRRSLIVAGSVLQRTGRTLNSEQAFEIIIKSIMRGANYESLLDVNRDIVNVENALKSFTDKFAPQQAFQIMNELIKLVKRHPISIIIDSFKRLKDDITPEQVCQIFDELLNKGDDESLICIIEMLKLIDNKLTLEQKSNYTDKIIIKLNEQIEDSNNRYVIENVLYAFKILSFKLTSDQASAIIDKIIGKGQVLFMCLIKKAFEILDDRLTLEQKSYYSRIITKPNEGGVA